MQKNAPSLPRILAMVIFALATIGVLMFLWISFGGAIPLAPKRYQLKIDFPEATTLAQEADVRIAGVTVGKVREKKLDKRGAATTVTLDIDPKYAPIPRDTPAAAAISSTHTSSYGRLAKSSVPISTSC